MIVHKMWRNVFFLSIIVLIIAATSVVIGLSIRTDRVTELLYSHQVINVLFVIEDGDGGVLSSNVLVYYPVSHRAVIVTVPGNTGVLLKSLGRVDRIDTAYVEKGIGVYNNEVSDLLGISIPFTVAISFNDFVPFVDLLGGIKVFIPEPVDALSVDKAERWLLPSGVVTLDGDKAGTYLRYRLENETDAAVEERCQNILIALFSAIAEKKAVVFARSHFRQYSSHLKMNVDADDAYQLFSVLSNIQIDYLIRQTVTGSYQRVSGRLLLMPFNNGELIRASVKQSTSIIVASSDTTAHRIYILEIQNGTTVQGLARNTGILLDNAGYDILRTINADRDDYETTRIIDHIGNRAAAELLGTFINCTTIEEETVRLSDTVDAADVDFTIILGKDFDGRYVRAPRTSE
ncbi:MAG: LCP family protein [Treponema sp.]|nr:LCP family protein [Treponema sp.]